jgi:hypothetical protein
MRTCTGSCAGLATSYVPLGIDRHDFIADLRRSAVFERDYRLSKLGRPVDPEELDMAPTTLKARYDRSTNSLTIPAGLIQPPFFDNGERYRLRRIRRQPSCQQEACEETADALDPLGRSPVAAGQDPRAQ